MDTFVLSIEKIPSINQRWLVKTDVLTLWKNVSYQVCRLHSLKWCPIYGWSVINSFRLARDSFRRSDELLSALHSQFNNLKLLDKSPKRKKSTGDRKPRKKIPQPLENNHQRAITEQRSTSTNPQVLLKSAAK